MAALELCIQIEKADPEVRAIPADTTIEELLRGLEAEAKPRKPEDMGLLVISETNTVGNWVTISPALVVSLNLTVKDTVVYQKKTRPQRLFAVDDSQKMILIDETQTLDKIRDQAAEKYNVEQSCWGDFGFRKKDDPEYQWLDLHKTLREQGVGPTKELTFVKRFFHNDESLQESDKTNVHFTYSEVRIRYVRGDFPLSYDEAVNMTALQFQADNGKYNEGQSNIQNLRMLQRTPAQYHSKKNLIKDVTKKWQALGDMDFSTAKHKFLQRLTKFDLYATIFIEVKEKSSDSDAFSKDMILGINNEGYVRINSETKQEISRTPFDDIRRWASTPAQLVFYHQDGSQLSLSTNRGAEIECLLAANYEQWALKYGTSRKIPADVPSLKGLDYTPLPFTPQAMFQDPEMVKKAMMELRQLEREVLTPFQIPAQFVVETTPMSSSKDTDDATDTGDEQTEEPEEDDDDDEDEDEDRAPVLENKELKLLEAITKLEARALTLRLETELLDSRLAATTVGKFDPETVSLKEQITDLQGESQVKLSVAIDKLMTYEDSLKVREEQLTRREAQVRKLEKEIQAKEKKVARMQAEGSGDTKKEKQGKRRFFSRKSVVPANNLAEKPKEQAQPISPTPTSSSVTPVGVAAKMAFFRQQGTAPSSEPVKSRPAPIPPRPPSGSLAPQPAPQTTLKPSRPPPKAGHSFMGGGPIQNDGISEELKAILARRTQSRSD